MEKKCKKCGCEIEDEVDFCSKCDKKRNNNLFKKKKFWTVMGIILLIIVVPITIVIVKHKVQQDRYNKLPIKVDISMTSYYGTIEYILYELNLDFDLVTMGANCYSGVQRNAFKTKKYGILHTEFRYCKSNRTSVFRVYNDTKDQKLREPKPGELSQFDKYGEKIKDDNKSNL